MSKPKIIYIQDPMCGWCYAFGAVMDEMQEKHSDAFDFLAVNGGMVLGESIRPISSMSDYILKAYKRIEEMSGIQFGEAYIELVKKGEYICSSETPGMALTVFKSFHPDKSIAFSHDIHYAHFYNGKSLNERETILEIVREYGIDEKDFIARMNNNELKQLFEGEVSEVRQLGIQGFPTVLCQKPDGLYMVCNGFQPSEIMDQVLKGIAEDQVLNTE
jgi:putative protein-disulfide isomerase